MSSAPGEIRRALAVVPSTNIIVPLTRFFGRGALLSEIDRRLAEGDRLLTLVGPPGAGKTRLALRWSELAQPSYSGGTWFVDLTEARGTPDLVAAVARTLGFATAQAASTLGAAMALLGPVALVLDNFEGLAREAGPLLCRWCEAAPQARILVTSRTRLGIAGEVALEVGPLERPPADVLDPQQIAAFEAVELFADRARAVRGRAYDEAELVEIAELVRELDGLPLAIELAAGRAHVLGPAEMRARLVRRFEVLSRRTPEQGDRHARLEAAIEASWVALQPTEQSALMQCGIFAGGFTLEAAEAVVDLEGAEVLEAACALRDRSLLTAEAGPGGTRFNLLASIRAFAAARRAELAPADGLSDRHARYFAEAAARYGDRLFRTGEGAARRWLEREQENLLAAVRTLLAKPEPAWAQTAPPLVETALAFDAVSLERSATERIELLALVHARAEATELGAATLARLCLAQGKILGSHGRAEEAILRLRHAARLAERAGLRAVEAEAENQLAVRHRQRSQFAESEALGLRALGLVRGTDHPRVEAEVTACLGLMFGELGRTDAAREADTRALDAFRALGDRASEGLALGNLAQLAQAAGQFDRGEALYLDAVDAFRQARDRSFEGIYLGLHAELVHERGELPRARAMYEPALTLLSRCQVLHIEGLVAGGLAALEASEGQLEASERRFRWAEERLLRCEVPAYLEAVRVHRGHLDLAEGEIDRAQGRLSALGYEQTSEAVRVAVRMLRRALVGRAPPPPLGLEIGPEGLWFQLPGQARVDLGRRGALRRILLALAERRAQGALGSEAILGAGWPGESVLPDAAGKRVRVAIATLRRLGLEQLILTRDDGYVLDPGVELRITSRS